MRREQSDDAVEKLYISRFLGRTLLGCQLCRRLSEPPVPSACSFSPALSRSTREKNSARHVFHRSEAGPLRIGVTQTLLELGLNWQKVERRAVGDACQALWGEPQLHREGLEPDLGC